MRDPCSGITCRHSQNDGSGAEAVTGMNIKGTALKTTRDFVRTRFPDQYENWLESLSAESRKIFSSSLDATAWYPYHMGYAEPVQKIMELCFHKDSKTGGDQLGRFSAETALKGFYKVFLLIASPQYLMQRASKIFTTYYDPSRIEAEIIGSDSAVLRIIEFDEIDESIEYRIAGWTQKALEMANCREPVYEIRKAMSKGDPVTEIHFNWL
jgi:hypothetical protein